MKTLAEVKELAKQNKFFLRLVADLIFTHSKDGVITDYLIVNENIVLFVPEEKIIGLPLEALPLKSYHRKEILQAINKTLETKQTSVVDYYVEINRSFKYFRATINYQNENEVISFIKEVTENVKSLISLKENEELFRTIVGNVSDGIILADENNTIKLWNSPCQKIFGYSRQEAIGNNFENLINLREKEESEKQDHTSFRLSASYTIAKHKSGKHKLVDIKDTTINYLNKPHKLIIVRDIEEQAKNYAIATHLNQKSKKINEALTKIFFLEASSFNDYLKEVIKIASETIEVNRVGVWFVDETTHKLKNYISYQYSLNSYFVDQPLNLEEINDYFDNFLKRRAIIVNNTLENGRVATLRDYFLKHNIKSMLDAIIKIPNKAIGVICFEQTDELHEWDDMEIAFATTIADKIAIEYENTTKSEILQKLELATNSLKNTLDKLETICQNTDAPEIKSILGDINALLIKLEE